MTHENDPTKHLRARVSFDPAIDRAAMGADFVKHFGTLGPTLIDQRNGTRDETLLRTHPGAQPCIFTLRPLSVMERCQVDSLPTAETRWIRALSYALVSCELHRPLATADEAVAPRGGPNGTPAFDMDALDWLAERVGISVLYEIGAVAYSRSKLGPFAGAFAPLPATSVYELQALAQSLADTHKATTSGTPTTDADSTSPDLTP